MQDIRRMTLGQVVDFCTDYNARHEEAEKKPEKKKAVKHYRLATPAEVTAFSRG